LSPKFLTVSEPSSVVPLSRDAAIGPPLLDRETISARIAELGAQITRDYEGRSPLIICVLRGAYVFTTDLARAIDLPIELDFIAVSSYGSATRTSGVVRLVKDVEQDISGRDVILVEDIVDTGLTLLYLRRSLEARGPASLQVCTFLARSSADLAALDVRYVGFTIAKEDFVIGYGLDLAQKYRNLPYLATYVGEA
jgi:hypoxanthine phosphoribosyltransferase